MDEQAQVAASDSSAGDDMSLADLMREAAGMAGPTDDAEGELPEVDSQPDNSESNAEEVEQEDGEEPADELVEIEIDGKKIKVSKEGAEYLLRQSDYTKKTQALAEERRQAQAETEAARVQRAQYASQLQQMAVVTGNELQQLQSLDWQTLIQNDPQQAMQLQFRMQQLQQADAQMRQEWQQLQAIEQQEMQTARQQYIADQMELIKTAIPEVATEEGARKFAGEVQTYMNQLGYSADEISRLADARDVQVLRKAMLYDQLMAKKPEVTQKVSTAPKPMKPGTPVKPTDGRTRAMQQLRSGDRGDRTNAAANIFEKLLG